MASLSSSSSSSSSNAAGIQAVDHRPWVEKYRPKDMSDLLGHEDITRTSECALRDLPETAFFIFFSFFFWIRSSPMNFIRKQNPLKDTIRWIDLPTLCILGVSACACIVPYSATSFILFRLVCPRPQRGPPWVAVWNIYLNFVWMDPALPSK